MFEFQNLQHRRNFCLKMIKNIDEKILKLAKQKAEFEETIQFLSTLEEKKE